MIDLRPTPSLGLLAVGSVLAAALSCNNRSRSLSGAMNESDGPNGRHRGLHRSGHILEGTTVWIEQTCFRTGWGTKDLEHRQPVGGTFEVRNGTSA